MRPSAGSWTIFFTPSPRPFIPLLRGPAGSHQPTGPCQLPHLPLMSSGPMYSGVPMRIVSMLLLALQALAKPKSHSFRRGGSRWSKMVLSSFKSLTASSDSNGTIKLHTPDTQAQQQRCQLSTAPQMPTCPHIAFRQRQQKQQQHSMSKLVQAFLTAAARNAMTPERSTLLQHIDSCLRR